MLEHLFDPEWLGTMAILFLTSMPVHEWAHAWAAHQLGDDTAALRGRLTLNPLAHIDPIGTLTLVIFGYGWGRPVPVNPYRLRGNMRASRAIVSAAGPFSNLVLAMLAAIPFRLGWGHLIPQGLQTILLTFILINLSLMLFNLIPIPPLDGSRILGWLLPRAWANVMDRMEQYGGMALMAVLFLISRAGVFRLVINPLLDTLVNALLFY